MGADPNTSNMNTLPTDWCIEATEENFAELYPWWRANADEGFKRFSIGHTLLSTHPHDDSCYFGNLKVIFQILLWVSVFNTKNTYLWLSYSNS